MTFSLALGQVHDAAEDRVAIAMDRVHKGNRTRQPAREPGFEPAAPDAP